MNRSFSADAGPPEHRVENTDGTGSTDQPAENPDRTGTTDQPAENTDGTGSTDQPAESTGDAAIVALRREIAQQLHDRVAHELTTLVLRAEDLRLSTELPPDAARELAGIVAAGRRSISELRDQIAALNSAPPVRPDPRAELVRLEQRLTEAGFGADVVISGEPAELGEPAGGVLAGCLVEAGNNVITHGRPGTDCVVRLDCRESGAELLVINTIDRRDPIVHGGLGLIGMRDRVAAIAGTLEAGPHPNELWVLEISLPTATEAANSDRRR